jgi:ribosomal protein L35
MVVVNYQGPLLIQGFVQGLRIPLFDRVQEIRAEYGDVKSLPITREHIASLKNVERLRLTKTAGTVTKSDSDHIEKLVPPCRLASHSHSKNKIEVELLPGYALTCSAP